MSGNPTVPIDTFVTAVSKKTDACLRSAVRHIFFDFQYATKDQLTVSAMNFLLARCPYVVSLFGPDILIHHPYDFRYLRRLALDLSPALPYITGAFTVPYFRSVTHVELLNDDWDDDDDPDLGSHFWTEINLVPHLTHLALNGWMEPDLPLRITRKHHPPLLHLSISGQPHRPIHLLLG
ncbi:hypothetical protein C8R47DRAFT_100125 [Mycena vitilis]|nr:hypothetical protein C8R47DRAFT_100125 [Mycena vitilis]